MNKYTELQAKHSKEINAFPMGFAFSNKQFEEAKEKLGVKSNDELLSIPGGGFIRKTDKEAFNKAFLKRCSEREEAMKDDDYLYQGFLYELANHEYCITCDPDDALSCFGLTVEDLDNDERIMGIFKKARTTYLDSCPEW